jgi:DNA-binding transcriptional ArsR family regulator
MRMSDSDENLPSVPSTHVASANDLRALANGVRLNMLGLLRNHEWTMSELAMELGLLKGSVSYHLRVLERARIVRQIDERSVRGGRQQLWTLTASSIAGDPNLTGRGERPAVLRVIASQMEASEAQRLFISQVRLDDAARETAMTILQNALASVRQLESETGVMVSLGTFSFSANRPTGID